MRLPGFSAERSVKSAVQCDGFSAPTRRRITHPAQTGASVVPAIAPRSAPGLAGCIADCLDPEAGWTLSKCRAMCTGGGGAVTPPKCTSADYNWQGLCYVARGACFALAAECGIFSELCAIPCSAMDCSLQCV